MFLLEHFSDPSSLPQPPTMVCQMEAQVEYVHIAYTFCTFGADLFAQLALNKISALELSRKFFQGPLLVGFILICMREENKSCCSSPEKRTTPNKTITIGALVSQEAEH